MIKQLLNSPSDGNPMQDAIFMKNAKSQKFSEFVNVDLANNMINKFLLKTGSPANGCTPYVYGKTSFVCDANQIKDYMDYAAKQNTPIVGFRLMFGLRDDSTNKDEISIIIAGIDANHKNVLFNGNKVIEEILPCPPCFSDQLGQPFSNFISHN